MDYKNIINEQLSHGFEALEELAGKGDPSTVRSYCPRDYRALNKPGTAFEIDRIISSVEKYF